MKKLTILRVLMVYFALNGVFFTYAAHYMLHDDWMGYMFVFLSFYATGACWLVIRTDKADLAIRRWYE